MENIIIEYKIPDFARRVKIAEERRATYYKKGEKIPAKYNNSKYRFELIGKKYLLCDVTKTPFEPVIKNKTVVGTPSYFNLEGQKVWQEYTNEKLLQVIKGTLGNYFWEVVKYLSPEDENGFKKPIRITEPFDIEFIFWVYDEGQDCDNLDTFYRKCFLDGVKDQYSLNKGEKKTLLQERLIPDDNKKYVRSILSRINDCKEGEECLQIIIKKTKSVIINYQEESVVKIDSKKLFNK